MDITYETAPLALQVMEAKINGTPGQMGQPSTNLGQKGLCMELALNKDTIEHILKEQDVDPLTDKDYLGLVKACREADAILDWMIKRRDALKEAIAGTESERDAAIAKALGKDAKAKK